MPDGAASAHEPDGRLVRRVRWQLIAWSAGSTFVVLLVLGAVLYAAVATTLASASENLLRDRASLLVPMAGAQVAAPGEGTINGGVTSIGQAVGGTSVVTGADAALPGFAVDGPYAGTLAVILPMSGTTGIAGAPTFSASEVTGGALPGRHPARGDRHRPPGPGGLRRR